MAPVPPTTGTLTDLTKRGVWSTMHRVKTWHPFSVDALGLITLFGAEEVNRTVGTLQKRRFTEWLPLLAGFMIAGDRFTEQQPGYCLYNLTEGITTSELKGWFTRWLRAQELKSSTTIFTWTVEEKAPGFGLQDLVAPLLSLLVTAPLLICTILIRDEFGIANCVAIIVSNFVRLLLLWQRRQALERAAAPRTTGLLAKSKVITLFVTRSDGKMVTIYAPSSVVMTLVRDCDLDWPRFYQLLQALGWLAFGAQAITLGMCTLFTQIYTVALLVFSTWAFCSNLSVDLPCKYEAEAAADGQVDTTARPFGPGSRLVVRRSEHPEPDIELKAPHKRRFAYLGINPTPKQEEMMQHWSLLPISGVDWYDDYQDAKLELAAYNSSAFGFWKGCTVTI